jgi:D-sedoheptulose 7-phosphate isomerase
MTGAQEMNIKVEDLTAQSRTELLRRNGIFESFFEAEAPRLAEVCHEMSRRFLAGGRLLAFGNGAAATDAQHVSVEFVHPVIVGKRALPALDLGPDFERRLPVLLQPEDMVMGFAFPKADEPVERAVQAARERGALTFSLTGEVGNSSFLYPFLGKGQQPLEQVVREVQGSMLQKMQEVNSLRTATAESEANAISQIAVAVAERLERGGKLITFGNGGSATDANDLVSDCVEPPPGFGMIPAVSLSAESANITAVANDIGTEAIFARQLIAHARPEDVAVGISTSGGSANILAALAEARRRGLLTVGIVGYDGGRIVAEQLADHAVVVHSDYIPRIQEVQASIYHVLRGVVERRMA